MATTATGLTSLNPGGELWTSVEACRLIAINPNEGNLLSEQTLICDTQWGLLHRGREECMRARECYALYGWIFLYTRQ